jgi:predicted DNA-binding ribbon-helix-helix protein
MEDLMRTLRGRSVRIAGLPTIVGLETASWEALQDVSSRRKCSVDELTTEIDKGRGSKNLSDAIRCYVVAYYRAILQANLDNYARRALEGVIVACIDRACQG